MRPITDKLLTFRQCLWLCLPALALGLVLRITFLVSLPEGFYGADSNSYFETADHLWNRGKWDMGPKRRGLYPLFVLANTITPGSAAQSTVVLQHAMGLAAVLGIGWITAHFTRRPKIWVPLVTVVVACLPQPLWYEHELIADKMLADAVVLAISLALPVSRLKTRDGLFLFLLGAATVLAVKPHGRPFWLGLMIGAVFLAGNPLRWGLRNYAGVAFSLLLIATTGSSKQSSWLFLSSTLPLVNTQSGQWPEYRQALRPLVEATRTNPVDYPWEQGKYKKILNHADDPAWTGPEWPALLRDDEKFSKVAKSLAVEGVKNHPVTFGRMVLHKFGIAMARISPEDRFDPETFWDKQVDQNESRWAKRPEEMTLLYEMDQAAYEKLVAKHSARPALLKPGLFQWSHYLGWFRQSASNGDFPRIRPTAFAWVGFLGILACLLPSRFRQGTLLVLPCMLYLTIVYVVGDSLPRYIMPVEWFGVLFGALGVDLVLGGVLGLFRRIFPPTSREPEQPVLAA